MKNLVLYIVLSISFFGIMGCSSLKNSDSPAPKLDKKIGRYFTDQPDVNDDYQIHFNYLLAKDSEDREWDINGEMEEILHELNNAMAIATSRHKSGDRREKKYKFDFRENGELDITFVRLDKKHKELQKSANNDIAPFLFDKGMNNPKKVYYNFADFPNNDGGSAGVGLGTTFLKSKRNWSKKRIILNVLHELHHTQGGGYSCVPGMDIGKTHYKYQGRRLQLTAGRKLGTTYAHKVEGCPQLMDSVYLIPTSKDPYDPYELNCLFKLGKYNHVELTKVVEKLRKKGKYDWRTKFGSNCQWRNSERDSDGYFMMGSNINILK